MSEQATVKVGEALFVVEVSDTDGIQTVGLDELLSFEGVRHTLEAVGSEVTAAWNKVKPSEASVEFGLNLTTKTGKLTGLIVEGGGEASLKVTITWKSMATT